MVKKVIRMYQTGQYVRYRGNGVFRVQNIVSKRLRNGEEKQYYVLEGVFGMEMLRVVAPYVAKRSFPDKEPPKNCPLGRIRDVRPDTFKTSEWSELIKWPPW